ncbi:MAG: hypothetical protein ACRELY_19875 [Polyangiaceae bacterium]
MSGSLQVAGVCAAAAVVLGASTWRLEGDPVAWSRVAKVGGAYRATEVDAFVGVPRPVQLARAFAWVVVALSVLDALLMLLFAMSREYESAGLSDPDGIATYGHYFDPVGATLYGLLSIMAGAVIGAFARWAKDAAKDVTQARRPMPIYVAVAIAVATVLVKAVLLFHRAPGFEDRRDWYDWRLASVYVGAVLLGAVLIARGRSAALGFA